MALDPIGIDKAVDTVDKQTIPEIQAALHSILDRLNGTKLMWDGSGIVLVIPTKK